ncbi:protein phosphatase 2C domain-containing protein [Nocardiopsis potens]|uniref:protein phosphatase 2C domain-containing protein n=1 Tax=Nocardiopsis potens TaxID=1246458 RepID=UPI00037E4E81|nr:protein phosphatase 2C domain-containing protein [Nocardiopsis potens]
MDIRFATRKGVGAENEDAAAAGPGWAFVVDGATEPPDADTGCRHGVRWLVGRLSAALAAELDAAEGSAGSRAPAEGGGGRRGGEPPARRASIEGGGGGRAGLPELLAAAIGRVRREHGPGCDLSRPDSPSAALAAVRAVPGGLEYLVLADCAVLLPVQGGPPRMVTDDRLDRLPGGRPYSRELVRSMRNRPGGFWVAGADPRAAHEAVTGVHPAPGGGRFGLLTDGCTRLAEYFGYGWAEVWGLLDGAGPAALIDRVRAEERDRPGAVRGKPHDDATALVGAFAPPSPPSPERRSARG